MVTRTILNANRLQLRLATNDDAGTLLEWRNNPITREASHNTALVSADEHRQWLTGILTNANRRLYVAEINNAPVGTVRVDSENIGYEFSWTVAPMMRGQGVGQAMVAQLAKDTLSPIRAEIKIGNIASVRIAEAAGMVFEREHNGVLHYQRSKISATSTSV